MIVCQFCHHPGAHAEVTTQGRVQRCTQCRVCDRETARADSSNQEFHD